MNLKRLEDTLVSVLENRPEGCQIVVVLNGPYEDPYDLKDEVCFVQAGAGAGFAESVNAGIAASQAEILHILTSGVEVTSGWADAAMACFADARAAAVAPLVLDRQRPERVVSAGLTYRVGGAVRRLGYGKRPEEIAVARAAFAGRTLWPPSIESPLWRPSGGWISAPQAPLPPLTWPWH